MSLKRKTTGLFASLITAFTLNAGQGARAQEQAKCTTPDPQTHITRCSITAHQRDAAGQEKIETGYPEIDCDLVIRTETNSGKVQPFLSTTLGDYLNNYFNQFQIPPDQTREFPALPQSFTTNGASIFRSWKHLTDIPTAEKPSTHGIEKEDLKEVLKTCAPYMHDPR